MLGITSRLQELYPDARASTITGEDMAVGGPDAMGGYMGVYARVVQPGRIKPGDTVFKI